MSLQKIQIPIQKELSKFEVHFKASMSNDVPLLDKVTDYIYRRKGKQMRPMFIFLSAKLCGEITEKSFVAASLVELLHTATLVHDDVVDDSNQRRGFFSVNALWRNKVAVLVGDYLFSRGLLLAIDKDSMDLLKIVSEAVKAMAEGELLQIKKARRLDIKESVYFEIIEKKTASLIASACSAGAASVTTDEAVIEKMKLFGEKIGIAFQIRDDLFDFGTDDIGKPLGIDIKEKKMTLPLIYALDHSSSSQKNKIIGLIKNHNENPEKVAEVIDFVRKSGGIEYAQDVMYKYREEAFEILNTFPDVDVRQSLHDLVIFVTERKK